ncbi:hypothetical protein T484DRAFT_1955226 [Baffinella frigidus]|nr:hypothetical protein T484DRAFT_1955226 [Cryptophyta sp. CCMP2293]
MGLGSEFGPPCSGRSVSVWPLTAAVSRHTRLAHRPPASTSGAPPNSFELWVCSALRPTRCSRSGPRCSSASEPYDKSRTVGGVCVKTAPVRRQSDATWKRAPSWYARFSSWPEYFLSLARYRAGYSREASISEGAQPERPAFVTAERTCVENFQKRFSSNNIVSAVITSVSCPSWPPTTVMRTGPSGKWRFKESVSWRSPGSAFVLHEWSLCRRSRRARAAAMQRQRGSSKC